MLFPKLNFTRIFDIIAIFFAILFFTVFFQCQAFAAIGINRQINFQGKLVNNPSATNVSDASYTIVFTLYDNPSGGTALWSETQNVTTTDGIFRVALGSVTPFPANFNFNWSGLYLGIKVNSDSEMTPRIQMAAVPFAFNAQQVAGLTVQDSASSTGSTSATLKIGTSATNPITVDLGLNNITFNTGAYSNGQTLTINSSGTTNITLPSSGTLLTNTATANQTITSTQTTGTILSLADSTGLSGAITGQVISLTSSTNSQNKTGISFDLSGGTGGTYYDLLGSGSTWAITRAGAFYANGSYGNAGDCLKSGGGATSAMTFGSCGTGGGVNWWNQVGGILSPVDTSYDLAIGATSTSSALFSFTGIQTGQTIASVSGTLNVFANNGYGGNASLSGQLVLGAFSNPVIQTTKNQGLTIGGDTTGFITFSPNNTATLIIAPNVLSLPNAATINSGGTLSLNTTGNQAITTGTGLTTLGGNLTVNGTTLSLANASGGTIQTTGTNQSLTLTPNGSGNIVLSSDFNSSVLVGSATVPAPLSISGGIGSNASLIVNQLNNGNIFTASSSGATKFVITNAGALSLAGGQTSDLDTLTATTLKIGATNTNALTLGNSTVTGLTLNVATAGNYVFQKNGSAFACSGTDKLTLNASGQLVCSTDQTGGGGGVNWWNLDTANGSLYPINSTTDLLIGGQSTSSASFAVLGLATNSKSGIGAHQTIASVSGNLIVMPNNGFGGNIDAAGNASIGGTITFKTNGGGTIQTSSNQGLTFGGNTTGEITFSPNGGTGKVIIGSTTNGLVFDIANGGTTYFGTGRPTKQIVLSPEYAGAVLTASNSAATTGTMTSDASPSANFRTYYEWASTQDAPQNYTVAVRVTLPQDFSAWQTGSNAIQINYNNDGSASTANKLDIYIYNPTFSASTPVVYHQNKVSTSWTTDNIASTELTNWQTAGQTATFYLKMTASGTYNKTRIGDIVLNYLAKF